MKVLGDFVADLPTHVHKSALALTHVILRSLEISRGPQEMFEDEVVYLQTQLCRQMEEAGRLGVGRVVEALQDRVFSQCHGGRGVDDSLTKRLNAADGYGILISLELRCRGVGG